MLLPNHSLLDMAMRRGGDWYCLLNPRPRLPNISISVPDIQGVKIYYLIPYPLGISDPVPYSIQIRKIIFLKENIKNLILEKIN